MNIELGKNEINEVTEEMKKAILEIALKCTEHDQLLSRKEVCELILRCAQNTASEHFLYAKGFPYVELGANGRRYPKKAVEKWIQDNTKYN
jgi:hypothetical protein